jgi:hypothetical protein
MPQIVQSERLKRLDSAPLALALYISGSDPLVLQTKAEQDCLHAYKV